MVQPLYLKNVAAYFKVKIEEKQGSTVVRATVHVGAVVNLEESGGLGEVRARMGLKPNVAYNPHITLARRPLGEVELYMAGYVQLSFYTEVLVYRYT